MRRVGWIALSAFVLLLAGCGGMGSLFKTEPVPVADLRGRWSLEAKDTAGCANGRVYTIRFTLELDDVGKDGAHAVNEKRSPWRTDRALGTVAGRVAPGWLGTSPEATLEFRDGGTSPSIYRGPIISDDWLSSSGTLEEWEAPVGERLGRIPCVFAARLKKD